ncbi:hypothetical protein LTR84_006934 [Exophiala bonariae]|uniref:BZIP domain-containing protein n=1 Tax=Exophiala bonariae TaxID=1690606 RepID=A0AAV9N1D3_9EURO|nr:hypothetical protein LTR84_006934 [Exophiala bonariae]
MEVSRSKKPRLGSTGSLSEHNDKPDAVLAEHQTPIGGSDEALDRRRLKKRESDRKCQRISRQRKKSRVAYLENMVDQLKEADASGQVNNLLQQISHLKSERDSFEEKLMAIDHILHPANLSNSARGEAEFELRSICTKAIPETQKEAPTSPFSPIFGDSKKDSPSDPEIFTPPELHAGIVLPRLDPFPEVDIRLQELKTQDEVASTLQVNDFKKSETAFPRPYLGTPYPTVSTQNTSLLSGHSCGCGQANAQKMLHRSIWYYGNITLGGWMKWPSVASAYPNADPYLEDTSVRVVVEGWAAIERRGNVHPIWRLMRRMDESLFKYSENSTMRLSILYGVARLMLAHIDQSNDLYNKLPPYLRDGPKQKTYAYATNFPAWPGIRRALSVNEHQYCSNHFWHRFINSMRLRWPFEFRDCYRYNKSNGSYSLSPTYLELEDDLHTSGVTRDFFDHYPEFRGMIAAVDEIPPSLAIDIPDFSERATASGSLSFFAQNQRPVFPYAMRGQMGPPMAGDGVMNKHEHSCQEIIEQPQSFVQEAGANGEPLPGQDPQLPCLPTGAFSVVEADLMAQDGRPIEGPWLNEEEQLDQILECSTSFHSTFFPGRDFL